MWSQIFGKIAMLVHKVTLKKRGKKVKTQIGPLVVIYMLQLIFTIQLMCHIGHLKKNKLASCPANL